MDLTVPSLELAPLLGAIQEGHAATKRSKASCYTQRERHGMTSCQTGSGSMMKVLLLRGSRHCRPAVPLEVDDARKGANTGDTYVG